MKAINTKILAILIGSMATSLAQAQLHSKGKIMITPNTRVTVVGNFTSNDTLVNKGELSISGNWENKSIYQDNSKSSLILDGSNTQTFNHNNQNVYNLVFDGGGEKQVIGHIRVLNSVDFSDGIVSPKDSFRIVFEDEIKIFGGMAASFVNGMLYQEGTGDKFYPVGKNGNYRPVWLADIVGTNPVTGFEMHEPNPHPIAGLGVISVSSVRYWERKQLSGDFSQAYVTLSLGNNDEGFTDITKVGMGEAAKIDGGYREIGNAKSTGDVFDGTVKSKQPGVGSYFALTNPLGIEELTKYFLPNALAPEAPNPEDRVIKIYSRDLKIEGFFIRIFDKDGRIVFESISYIDMSTKGWDGMNIHTGLMESPGSYDYQLGGKFIGGKEFSQNGTIQLVR